MPRLFSSLLVLRQPTSNKIGLLGGTSKSRRLKHSVRSGFVLIRSSLASSSGSVSTLTLTTVDMSTSPRCLSGGKFSLIIPGG